MRSFFRFALLALLLVLVALVSALTAMRFAIHGEEVAVPELIGLTPADAEHAAGGLGLQVAIERQYYSATVAEGRITSQLPAPGTKVRRGWQVRVAQSLGPQRVAIPDVAGESDRAAEFNIRRRGLDVASRAEMKMPGAVSGQILAQSPPANASQVAAPKISLLITGAPEPAAYVMPSFVGQPLGTVARTLQDSGFKLGNVAVTANGPAGSAAKINSAPEPGNGAGQSASPTAGQASPYAYPAPPAVPRQPAPASIVVSQSPAAGQKVWIGATINFEVR